MSTRIANAVITPWLAAGILLLTACAGVPFDHPKSASQYLPADNSTRVGEIAETWVSTHGDHSGFIGLPDGIQALGARLKMMEAAERGIDAQYFIIKKDRAGALFAGKLLSAADRGVRVRLLVDDIFTPGTDQAFTLLNSHPNIEVRLFNPVSRQSFKYWGFLADFSRANRRMHNKSFTVDNGMTIVGGRNIGEEYFELNQDVKFDDYEVLAIGPVVSEVSAGFDEFWNSELSVPMDAFGVKVDPQKLDEWRDYIRRETEESDSGIYAQAVNSSFITDVQERRITPVVADATLVTDHPDKLLAEVGDNEQATLALEIGRRFREAEREIIIITPYFIPLEEGAQLIESLLQRGVQVIIITNSMASTNHLPVHSAYTRYRKRLLHAGAEIYEIRALSVGDENAWGHSPELVTLHSKATVIDRETIFIGSLNFDPRSILINTEMGLFIESPEVGEAFTQAIREGMSTVTYRVEVDENDRLQWIYQHDDIHETFDKEPLTSWWRRTQSVFYRLLPESQL